MTFAEIKEALEQATGGDWNLDKEILKALGFTWRGMAYWSRDGKSMWTGPVGFTSSIDAATTLISSCAHKKVDGPRRYLNIPSPSPNYWRCEITMWNPMRIAVGWGATEALAICVAAINHEMVMQEESRCGSEHRERVATPTEPLQ